MKRFSKSEVLLARRIQRKVWLDSLKEACQSQGPVSGRLEIGHVVSSLLCHSGFPQDPPWWDQAVAEADSDLIWVPNFGWMPQSYWNDVLSVCKNIENWVSEGEDDEVYVSKDDR
jgi:hypothetical protein